MEGLASELLARTTLNITNAGSNLELIVNGSSVTTEATDNNTLAALSCIETDQVAKRDGAQWTCQREENASRWMGWKDRR